MNRFHNVIAECRALLQKSARLLFQYQYLCIEAGFLNNRIAAYQLKVQLRGKDPQSSETTARAAIGLDDKALRNTGANAVVIAMLLLSSPDNLRLMHMLTDVGMCVMDWHAFANRECRDVFRNKLWLLDQVTGGFERHLNAVTKVLEDIDILTQCGFISLSVEATQGLSEAQVLHEDEHAELFGEMVLVLLGLRFRRCVWMFEPPVGMIALLSADHQKASQSLNSMRSVQEDFDELQSKPWSSARVRQVIGRHPCNLLSSQQIITGLRLCDWNYRDEKVQKVLHERLCLGWLMISWGGERLNHTRWGHIVCLSFRLRPLALRAILKSASLVVKVIAYSAVASGRGPTRATTSSCVC